MRQRSFLLPYYKSKAMYQGVHVFLSVEVINIAVGEKLVALLVVASFRTFWMLHSAR